MAKRRRLLARALALLGALALVLTAAFAVLAVHEQEFQLEGNATAADLSYVDLDLVGNPPKSVETPGSLVPPFDGDFDWDSLFDNTGPGGTGNEKALPAGFTGSDFVVDFKSSGTTFITSDDTTFATGSKDTLDITPGWQCNQDNNVNSKTDIINGYAALYESASDRILYFGLEKDVDNGTNNVGLWLFQDPNVGCTSTGGSVGFTGHHVPGDLFLVSAFTRGGGVANITAYQWVADLNGNGTPDDPGLDPNPIDNLVNGDCLDTSAGDRLCAVVNGKNITMPWKSADSSVIDAPKVSPNFFEGGISLTDFPQFAESCFTGFMLETRSSQSLTATLFDYVLGDIDTCHPELALDKEPETGTHNVGDAFNWTLTVANTGTGPADDAVVSDTIPAGLTIAGTPTVNPVAAGTCGVVGQVVTCTIDVAAASSVTITVPVQSTLGVFGTSQDGCVSVNNTGTVTVDGDTNPGDNSDTVTAQICRPLVSKTAAGTYRELHSWDVEKTVSPTPQDGFAGDSFNYTWNIDVTETVTEDTFAVAGTITVQNPSPSLPMSMSLSDALNGTGGTGATISGCTGTGVTFVGGTLTVPAATTASCSYSAAPTNRSATLNTATAVFNAITFTGTAAVGWTPTTVNPTVTLDDDDKPSGFPVVVDGSEDDFSYGASYQCSTDKAAYTGGSYAFSDTNTATLTAVALLDSDTAVESITCYIPAVSKGATATYRELHTWDVEKSVSPTAQDGFIGDSFSYTWDIAVTETVTDDTFSVSGTITVVNPNPSDVLSGTLTDELNDAATTDAVISGCTGTGVTFVGGTLTIPAGGTASCAYTATPAGRTATQNTATFVKNAVSFTGSAALTWTPTIVNPTVTLDDDQVPTLPVTIDGSEDDVSYQDSYQCSTNKGAYTNGSYVYTDPNTATIKAGTTLLDSDSATETITCYIPTVSKTAAGSYGELHTWDVLKTVTPTAQDGNIGDAFTYTWNVNVTEVVTEGTFSVTGNVTVVNPNPSDPLVVSLTDELNDAGTTDAVFGSCTGAGVTLVSGTLTVPAGVTAVCAYTATPGGKTATLNTATAVLNGVSFPATDPVEWTATVTNPTVTLDDDQNPAFPVTVDGSEDDFSYQEPYTCSTSKGSYTDGSYTFTDTNTATLRAGATLLDSSFASTSITCYIPSISKTAAGSYRELHTWDVEKTVSPTSQNANAGDIVDYDWTIVVDETVTEDTFSVIGSISVHNPNPSDAMAMTLADELNDGATTDAAISGCTGTGVTFVAGTLTIPAGGTAVCAYTASPAGRTATSNTATATIAGVGFAASDPIEWTPNVVNPEVTLDDDQAGDLPRTVSADGTFPYDDGYTCSANVNDYNASGTYTYNDTNRATLKAGATLLDEDSASTAVHCFIPLVAKTADGSYDRDWTWTIDKTANNGLDNVPISTLDLMPDQTFLVHYEVTVNASKVDKNFEVAGSISITNPNPSDDMTLDVTDALDTPASSLPATAIQCNTDGVAGTDEDGDDVVVQAGETITCYYKFTGLAGVTAGASGTNTATATMGAVSVSDTDPYTFAKDAETDECITVSDSVYGPLGSVCAADAPRTFEYDVLIGPFDDPDECGDNEVPNTASFVTNDTGTTGSDPWTIIVTIECEEGCTLTQGYWKTHSEYGPAPEDPNWMLLPDVDGDTVIEGPDETFYLSGKTWYQVFWINPNGNAYYQLAHQYMAAVLNGVAGASTTAVTSELAHSDALFDVWTPDQIGKLKGRTAPRPTFISLAGKLASYNEGRIGPGHCDEDRLSSRTP